MTVIYLLVFLIGFGERGSEFREGISRDSQGWKFSSFVINQPEYRFDLWLRDDGRVACRNGMNNKVFVTKEVFDPNSKNDSKIANIALELYKTVEQLKDYEKRDLPISSTYKLRKKKLETTLKLLGYDSIDEFNSELDDSKGYLSLSTIGKQLENYVNLGEYVHLEGRKNEEDVIRIDVPEGITREQFIEIAMPVTEEYSQDLELIEKREQKTSVLSDYGAKISSKMPYNDWLIYSNVVKETARLLLELNADLLNQDNEVEVTDCSQLTGIELKDRISLLIDSKAFSKACEIEKTAIRREGERLIRKIDSMLEEMDESTYNSSVAKALIDIKKEEIDFISQDTGIGLDD